MTTSTGDDQEQAAAAPIPHRLYSVPKVAAFLGISEPAVRGLIRRKQLAAKHSCMGGQLRVSGQAILDYVGVRSGPEPGKGDE